MHTHDDDIQIDPDGKTTTKPKKVVAESETLHGDYMGGICVHSGTFTIGPGASHSGSLRILPAAQVIIRGSHNGSLHVSDHAQATVHGRQSGSVHVASDGRVLVERNGRLAGSLHNSGVIENKGIRGGTDHSLGGQIIDLPGGTVRSPSRTVNGASVYEW